MMFLIFLFLLYAFVQPSQSECWAPLSGFTQEACCDTEAFGLRGNPRCWDIFFNFDKCCLKNDVDELEDAEWTKTTGKEFARDFRPKNASAHDHYDVFVLLQALNYEPTNVLDVGAAFGEWSLAAKGVWPSLKGILVEPNSDYEPAWSFLPSAFEVLTGLLAGSEDSDKVDFHVTEVGDPQGSSTRRELSWWHGMNRSEVRQLPQRTLDSLAAERSWPAFDIVKLDLQGAEVDVVMGAKSVLQGATWLVVEVCVLPYNEGAPSLLQVLELLERQAGFRLFRIIPLEFLLWKPCVDAFFVKAERFWDFVPRTWGPLCVFTPSLHCGGTLTKEARLASQQLS